MGDIVPWPRGLHDSEGGRAHQREHAIAGDDTRRRRRHQRRFLYAALRRAEHRHPDGSRPASRGRTRRTDHDRQPAHCRRTVYARADQPGRHAVREDLPLRRQAHRRGRRSLQSVQLERRHRVSADVRVRDQRRLVVEPHGDRRSPARAIQRDGEFLTAFSGGSCAAGPPDREPASQAGIKPNRTYNALYVFALPDRAANTK